MPPADKVIIDLGDLGTAFDAAKSLVFHHPELLTLMNDPADTVLNLIEYADGLLALAQSMLDQSQANQQDPTQPNWVNSQAGTDWRTGQPSAPIYVWSAQTVENLALPLQSALRQSKNAPDLQGLQPGITQVPLTDAAQGARLGTAEANYTVKELTPQSGVENSFSFDPSSKTATINLKNWYLRWLMVSLDQYGPNGAKIAGRDVRLFRDWYVRDGEWYPEVAVPLDGAFSIPDARNGIAGQRNVAAALLIATQNFPTEPGVVVMLLVSTIAGLVVLLVAARRFARGADPRPV